MLLRFGDILEMAAMKVHALPGLHVPIVELE